MNPPSRAVLITGASSGIGRACALDLAGDGWLVYAGVRREEAAAELRSAGEGRIVPLMLDVTDAGQIAAAAEMIARQVDARNLPGLHGLVNNAGIVVAGPIECIPIQRLREQFEVNVVGQVAVTQAMLSLLRRPRPGGRVVNVGSISGRVASPLLGPYAMSKHAMEAFSDSLRRELAAEDIHVALIQAGPLATPIWDRSMPETEALVEQAGESLRQRYAPLLSAMRGYIERTAAGADPVELAVNAVGHALSSPRPRRRYPVGRGIARRLCLLRLLPDAAADWMIQRRLRRAMDSAGRAGG